MPTKRKKAESRRNGAVDEAGIETFPASDPPAYAGGAHSVGAPARPARMRAEPKSARTSMSHTKKRKGR